MSKPKWTDAQLAAIHYDGEDLLLSAAAGSGKTATLTERIVSLLTAPDSTAEISRMLCVTFTRAAAAELRERIGRNLTAALAENRGNARLTRQLYDLGRARITTIHSFCLDILRSHAAELGLPAGFAVAEEADVRNLSRQVMTDVLSDCFDGGEDWFIALADTLAGARNESSLDEALLTLAESLESAGMSPAKLDELARDMCAEADFFSTPAGAGTRTRVMRFARHYGEYFTAMMEEFAEDERFANAYIPAAAICADTARDLLRACEAGSYTAARAVLAAFAPPARLGSVSTALQTEDVLYFKEQYTTFKQQIAALLAKSFALNEADIAAARLRTAETAQSIARVLGIYFDTMHSRKKERGIVDFGDLERLTAALFTDENGQPTDAARQAGAAFDYIFIDEYQDTNHLQDSIFSSLAAGGGGRFMVGDIKQSIYRFRGAEPEVFSSYRRAWPTAEEDPAATARSLFMQENFRCDSTVVDFVNLVSRHIFSTGAIPFTKSDELKYAKPAAPDKREYPVEVRLIPAPGRGDGDDTPVGEAEYVAKRISQMLGRERREDGTPLAPSDIAILLRSPGTDGAAFAQALEARGIRVQNRTASALYEQPEVLLMLSVLYAIDNPTRDIHLAAAMKSPVFAFTLDDLVRIRRAAYGGSLWDAVLLCGRESVPDAGVGEDLSRRCGEFAQRLSNLRRDARGMGADKLILRLYEETDIFTLLEGDDSRDSTAMRANLGALYEEARRFENAGGGGLYPFLARIAALAETGGAMPQKDADAGAVRIFSIHQSKGLEFPVCFLSRTAKLRNSRDTSARVLFDSAVGVAMKLPDEGGLVQCDTPIRQSIAATMTDAAMEEEMRILYVAMTRARERLIITATLSDPEKVWEQSALAAPYLTDYSVYGASRNITWILHAIAAARRAGEDISSADVQIVTERTSEEEKIPETAAAASEEIALDEAAVASYRTLFTDRFAYTYPHAALRGIPAKLTVSRLYPGILDEIESAESTGVEITRAPTLPQRGERNRAPRFLSGKTEFEASFAGTATHTFMQFCDFDHLAGAGAEAELSRLIAAGFLSPTMADAVRIDEVEMFRQSDLFARMRRASYMRREFRFNASLPAWEFTEDESLAADLRREGADIIVQGVVDCLFIDEDGRAVLVDYKTDRLTDKEIADPALAAEKLIRRHETQLKYYRAVCADMFGRAIDKCVIYSLPLGKDIEME